MTLIIPEDINLPVRDSTCTCSDHQLIHVGCDCEAGDPIVFVSCWPTGKAQGRAQSFRCRGSYADVEARRLYGQDAKVFAMIALPKQDRPFTAEYIREMSQGG